MDLPEITDARALRLRPGDVLALRLDHEPEEAEFKAIEASLRHALPHAKVLIFGPGIEISVISQEADEP